MSIVNHLTHLEIGISDLAAASGLIEGDVYRELVRLSKKNQAVIIKRYYCPKGHFTSGVHCPECGGFYSPAAILTEISAKLPQFVEV